MSDIFPYLIIAVAIALVVGPVMLMRPSQRQQRQLKLRNCATQQGLRVHMMPLPTLGAGSQEGPSRPCAAYCLAWPPQHADTSGWLLLKGKLEHEIHFHGVWVWATNQAADDYWHALLRTVLQSLPDGVLALGNGPQGLSIYWNEVGDEAAVKALADLLKDLQQRRLKL